MNYFLNKSIWPIDGKLSVTTTSDQSGPWSNGNAGVHHTSQIYKTCASLADSGQHFLGLLNPL